MTSISKACRDSLENFQSAKDESHQFSRWNDLLIRDSSKLYHDSLNYQGLTVRFQLRVSMETIPSAGCTGCIDSTRSDRGTCVWDVPEISAHKWFSTNVLKELTITLALEPHHLVSANSSYEDHVPQRINTYKKAD